MWWLLVVYLALPLVGCVALWRSSRRWSAAVFYLSSALLPPLTLWLAIQSAVLIARPGQIVGMPVVWLAGLFAAAIWFGLVIAGCVLAFHKGGETIDGDFGDEQP